MDQTGCIGRANALPWKIPEDMKHFKALTTGHAVIMGRKTFESIGRPLPNRRNIIVSSQLQAPPGTEVFSSFQGAVETARTTDPDPFVIGGSRVYADALPLATYLHVTHVSVVTSGGDVFFPPVSWSNYEVVSQRTEQVRIGSDMGEVRFVSYRRR